MKTKRFYSFLDLSHLAAKACRDAIHHLGQRDIESAHLALAAARIWSYRADYALTKDCDLQQSDFPDADAWAYDEQAKAFQTSALKDEVGASDSVSHQSEVKAECSRFSADANRAVNLLLDSFQPKAQA